MPCLKESALLIPHFHNYDYDHFGRLPEKGVFRVSLLPNVQHAPGPRGLRPRGLRRAPAPTQPPRRARAGYKNPKIDPRLLDPKFAFEELQDARKVRRAENDMAGRPAALE